MKNKYPGILWALRPPSLRFAQDGVHLVDRSSHTMFKIVKELCKDFFFRPCDDDQLSDHEPLPDEKEPTNDEDETKTDETRTHKRRPNSDDKREGHESRDPTQRKRARRRRGRTGRDGRQTDGSGGRLCARSCEHAKWMAMMMAASADPSFAGPLSHV